MSKNTINSIAGFLLLILGWSSCGSSTVLVSGDVNTPETAYAEGLRLMQAGAYDKSKAAFERARALDPDYAAAYEGLSRIAFKQGNRTEAIRHIQIAKIKNMDYAPAWIFTGLMYNSAKQYQEALVEFQEALNRDPDGLWTVTTYYHMARTYEQMQKPEEAYTAYGNVVERDGLHLEARKGQERVKKDLPPGFFNPWRN